MLRVLNFKTEYMGEAMGIDTARPRFFWQLDSDMQGCRQTAYELFINGESLGRVESDNTLGIYYDGAPLLPETRYTIRVKVWDNKGEEAESVSFFETGLGTCGLDLKPWEGAKFIGGEDEDLVYYPHYLPVFKGSYELKLEEGSDKAGFVLGANDERLMSENLNILGVKAGKDESYIYIETDISGLKEGKSALLNIYRAGYTKEDKADTPFKSIEVPFITKENANDLHKVSFFAVCGMFDFWFDGEDDDHRLTRPDPNDPRPAFLAKAGVNLNPMGEGCDYISFPCVCDTGVKVPAGNRATLKNITIKNYREPGNTLYKEDEVTADGGSEGFFEVRDNSRNAIPILRKAFNVEEDFASARLYITARGIYEVELNGKRVGDDMFNPGATQYNKTMFYQTYDITGLLKEGENEFITTLGEGWWSGALSFTADKWNYFGDRSSLLAKIVIIHKDGRREVIVTDESWDFSSQGPIKCGSFFQGQITDLREKEILCKKAVEVPLDEHTAYIGKKTVFGPFGPSLDDMGYEDFKLTGQVGPTVKISERLTAVAMTEPRPGVYVYDMGQNLAGIPSISLKGRDGQKVRLRFAEVLYPDLPAYKGNEGMVMLENIRAAYAQDIFFLKEGANILEPHFTFHGYRYVEITGIDEPLPLAAVKGIAISSVPTLSAGYVTSNPEVNKLWENISWSLRDNYISIPTDCPQRNERMGWSGDLSVFSRSAVHMADSSGFLRRHMMAMRDTQDPSGRFADIAPIGGGFGGILWGSAGITAAYESYLQYKDTDMLSEHYNAMKRYVDYLDTRRDPGTGIINEGPLGDWLAPEYVLNETALLFTAYYAYDLRILSKMAESLGLSEDSEELWKRYEKEKELFNRVYVDETTHRTVFSSEEAMMGSRQALMMAPTKLPLPGKLENGKYLMDTQTSYAVPLALGIFADEYVQDAGNYLEEAVKRVNHDNDGTPTPPYSLMTGFIGTAWIAEALTLAGKNDTVYRLVQNGEYPSWICSVRQGATTIWERVNSYTKENGFGNNNSMNSFNHYSYGAVAAWMIRGSLGIKRLEDAPGFSEFVLCPVPDPTGLMKSAKGYLDTVSGRIESSWEITDDAIIYRFKIPANTGAIFFHAGKNEVEHLTSGEYVFKDNK